MRCDQAEVSVAQTKVFQSLRVMVMLKQSNINQDKVIEITVYFGKRSGSASISDIRPEAMRAAVEAACHIAKFTG